MTIAVSICSAVRLSGAASTLNSGSDTTKLLPPEMHSASQRQAAIALNCVCGHLCLNLIYFVHPLARCVLR